MKALNKCKKCIDNDKNFVLQGGAGSGKTESLKRLVGFIQNKYPSKKIVCITHTNLAVDEIKNRISGDYEAYTIHSFLNSIIKNYKKNMYEHIHCIFQLDNFYEKDHKNFKKLYEKYSKKIYSLKSIETPKVPGKRDFEKNPEEYIEELNDNINKFNNEIKKQINNRHWNMVKYNETQFDNLDKLTFGHDSLLKIAYILFKKYNKLSKIISDKYDYILIDEYQDTNEKIIEAFLDLIDTKYDLIIGLFGDSMQSIYDDGIGNIKSYINKGLITEISKPDNYRCSQQVIDLINKLRIDSLQQEVALKKINGKYEKIEDRQGKVEFYYSVCEDKPTAWSSREEKAEYNKKIENNIKKIVKKEDEIKILMLTNKSIAKEIGFGNLYKIFDDRYYPVGDHIEEKLNQLQFDKLYDLCIAYEEKNYNYVLSEIKKTGFKLSMLKDKNKLKKNFDEINKSNRGAIEILEKAFDYNLLGNKEKYIQYKVEKEKFINDLKSDKEYIYFEEYYNNGKNTFNRMKKVNESLGKGEFNEFERMKKKKEFYKKLFSSNLKFVEIINYYNYLNEKANYITMHKTKGSSIKNILIVLEEYYWNKYNFRDIIKKIGSPEKLDNLEDRVKRTLKLFYVATSRTESNLYFFRMIKPEERDYIRNIFANTIEV